MARWQRAMSQVGLTPPDDRPLALIAEGSHGPVICATNRAARLSGVRRAARVVDMRALCPDLSVEDADPEGDMRALDQLVLWSRQWCPWTVRDGLDGMILDTTGADHLLGGEATMLAEIEARLSGLGQPAQLAVAPAWALARHGPVRAICPADQTRTHLGPLPVDALRLDADTILLLHRLGLKTIGALNQVPRLSLARRFSRAALSANPLLRLEQALGTLAEPVASEDAPAVFRSQARLPEPVQDPTPYLPELCTDLCRQMAAQGVGCRQLHLMVYRTDGELRLLQVATWAANRDPDHLRRLFNDRLEKIDPGFGFDLITLQAGGVEDMAHLQAALDRPGEDHLQLPQLIDRLTARFGPRAVKRPVLRESHVPERAEGWVQAIGGAVPEDISPVNRPRPLRLLDPPEEVRVLYAVPEGPPAQFVWRRQTHQVARYAGPERIAPEWWHDRPSTRLRDYFRVEDQTGHRFWLYREGLYEDGRGGDPRWFVHGIFA